MKLTHLTLLLAGALSGAAQGTTFSITTRTPTPSTAPQPNFRNPYGGNQSCHECPGWCGDGELQADHGEQCDLGPLNGQPQSGCSIDCKLVSCCGDGIVDYAAGEQCDDGANNGKPWSLCSSTCLWNDKCKCGNGITEYPEQCDDGDLNGTPFSHCTTDCTWKKDCGCDHPSVCGNGVREPGEDCDDGWARNGQYGSNCTTECKFCDDTPPRCGDGFVDAGEQCDDGAANGSDGSDCDATCHWKTTPSCPYTCDPNPFNNRCTITTSCINYLDTGRDYCACRAGYRANDLAANDPRQFRLAFPGQEYRVFVAPGIECDQLCDAPFPGPDSCKEVSLQNTC